MPSEFSLIFNIANEKQREAQKQLIVDEFQSDAFYNFLANSEVDEVSPDKIEERNTNSPDEDASSSGKAVGSSDNRSGRSGNAPSPGETSDSSVELSDSSGNESDNEPSTETTRALLEAVVDVEERTMDATGNVITVIDNKTRKLIGSLTYLHSEQAEARNHELYRWRNVWPFYRLFLSGLFNRKHRPLLARYGANMHVNEWLAEQHDEIMGDTEHLYIVMVAASSACRGKGVGSALMRAITEQADGLNVPCYLEATNKGLTSFYGRFGFELVPNGARRVLGLKMAPKMFFMVRKPRSAAVSTPAMSKH
ncbi:Acetyltransferase (GNAT) domain [Carpediemonas membranifera]|uniref:Acetyltransferase (GNAT) domain n=1 Tax=Carpediemonas membranifera TaxID=201153 RepID=A0A8J6ARE3_9EUKA|nr:Acetyltransferase (GNAT) domain [Carpediemonas membranifera]|eukprot:KAG9392371.1 Acetyltransferase (GNAT) domain [Carpediemonas membranifera]